MLHASVPAVGQEGVGVYPPMQPCMGEVNGRRREAAIESCDLIYHPMRRPLWFLTFVCWGWYCTYGATAGCF